VIANLLFLPEHKRHAEIDWENIAGSARMSEKRKRARALTTIAGDKLATFSIHARTSLNAIKVATD
jgi:hypothetical protein